METFEFLCSICKYTDAFAVDNRVRKSVELPLYSDDITSYAMPNYEAMVTMPVGSSLIVCVSSYAVTKNELGLAKKEAIDVMLDDGTLIGNVNKLLYRRAELLMNNLPLEIEGMLTRGYRRSASPPSTQQSVFVEGFSEEKRTEGEVNIGLADRGSGDKDGSTFKRNALSSPLSVVTLAKVFIGGKLLRMHRFSDSFFQDKRHLIVLTGHGIGGGICEIMAYLLYKRYGGLFDLKVVTFGSPSVGNVMYYNSLKHMVSRHYKFELQHDGMSRMFSNNKAFGSAPNIVRLNKQGNYAINEFLCCIALSDSCDIHEYYYVIQEALRNDSTQGKIVGCLESSDDVDLKRL